LVYFLDQPFILQAVQVQVDYSEFEYRYSIDKIETFKKRTKQELTMFVPKKGGRSKKVGSYKESFNSQKFEKITEWNECANFECSGSIINNRIYGTIKITVL
jgi:hypothetical protein